MNLIKPEEPSEVSTISNATVPTTFTLGCNPSGYSPPSYEDKTEIVVNQIISDESESNMSRIQSNLDFESNLFLVIGHDQRESLQVELNEINIFEDFRSSKISK
ncbi:Hypothetical_protein [Hexamita inflata]|uniref:Hypothetical_protein n=1 Tax=Hexamita inflata TaxID=28002 RepID=A0AA86QA18_9EUKA|nr:Hypothetical protein HINF_LOCUS39188 [Hexamita inflata]